mmetsp:Transcript_100730/g.285507  ORF Transcript_100730/g.285507 Transcript_100730/m.285507 type:complete len:607 (-) Transcript_100730:114-1934(-)
MEVSGGASYLLSGAVVVGVVSSAALLHCAQREVGWFSFLTSLFGFVLSFGIIALVPYDVWDTLAWEDAKQSDRELPARALVGSSWEVIYWAALLLCWVLCPVLIEYEAAGDFTAIGKLRASLRRNTWCAGYTVAGTLLLLVWLYASGGAHGGPVAWCIAASNAWGLLVSTVLMGYGLVAVPRHFWRQANPGEQLRMMYSVAATMEKARLSTQYELHDMISEARTEILSRNIQNWDPAIEAAFNTLQATLEECEQLHCELTNGARGPREQGAGQGCGSVPRGGPGGEDATRIESLAQLHRALKQAGLEARRAACRWDGLVGTCLMLENLEEQKFPSEVEVATSWQGTFARMFCRCHSVRTCWRTATVLWLARLRSNFFRLAGILCGLLSFVIVLGQLTMFTNAWSFSVLSLLFQRSHGFGLTQVLCVVPLTYIVCAAYWSVFRLEIAGWYGLYPNHNTDTSSLLWCASIFARLAAPLCYHFLFLIRVKGTALQAMMGQMNVVPVLGQSFNEIIPVLTGLLCVCNLLNVYSRIIHFFGLESLEFEGAQNSPADPDEGRGLIERERRRRYEDRSLLELHERGETIPLRLQILQLIEDGTLPCDWNAHSM